ncbi:MAG: glycosyltransferase family 2 protein [Planctomycetaceae bacterium]|nr:glycosyltransferase family 2 protein [Planctomycetaceae bacterium]
MDPRAEDSGGSLIESETELALDGSTLATTPPRSATFVLPNTLTLIVPVFNEAESFPQLIRDVERYVAPPFRLLLVYDADRDTTASLAREFAKSRPWLELVRNERVGLAHALRTGFTKARTGPVVVVAADGADDLHNLSEMRRLYTDGNHLVAASRYSPGGAQLGAPLLRRWLSRWASWTLRKLAAIPVSDATNSFRLYDAGIVNEVGIESRHGCTVALELTAKFAARGEPMAEVPTTRTVSRHAPKRLGLLKRMRFSWEWFLFALQHRRKPGRQHATQSKDHRSTRV